jgi:hypothetical protein
MIINAKNNQTKMQYDLKQEYQSRIRNNKLEENLTLRIKDESKNIFYSCVGYKSQNRNIIN